MALTKPQKRLQFVHVAWALMVLAAVAGGWIARVPTGALAAVGALAILPGVFGSVVFPLGVPERTGQGFLVISWTVMAVVLVAFTGTAASPLAVLFIIAPLVALNMKAERMAGEAAVFGILAWFATAVLGLFGMLPLPRGGAVPLAVNLALAGLVAAGALVWFLVRRGPELPVVVEHQPEDDQSEQSQTPIIHLPPDLPEQAGIMMLDVSEQGLIARVSGDRMGLGAVHPGTPLWSLFEAGTPRESLLAREDGNTVQVKLANNRPVRLFVETVGTRKRITLADMSDIHEELAAAKAGEADALQSLKDRTAFFASLGHELRTPLNAVLLSSDIMNNAIRGPFPDDYKDYVGIIQESGQDLLLMVEDILDLAKADAGRLRLEPEPVELGTVAQSVMSQLQNHADRAGVHMVREGREEVWAEADARSVRQIWQNLLTNAIKYSDRGAKVVLKTEMRDGVASLSVTDTGEGMSAEDLKHIFEPFTQGENAKGRAGTGLGLAMVKSFAEMQGGGVDIKSAIGEGTTVTVSLPTADLADLAPFSDEVH